MTAPRPASPDGSPAGTVAGDRPAILPADSLADTAVAYALLGWRIFPVVPGGKVPQFRRAHPDDAAQAACPGGHVCGRLGHGFKDATADPERVARWWAREPRCNIGLATGYPGSPDVLDIDVKDGAPGLASLKRIQDVGLTRGSFAMASTPSGGWHLYYDGTVQSSATLKKHGIDFRATGGYVVAPESWVGTTRNPRRYRWVPQRWNLMADGTISWADIRDFLNPPRPAINLQFTPFVDDAAPIVNWFVQQPSGSRNNALFWAACRILESGYPAERLDDLRHQAILSGLGDAEIRKTLASAVNRIIGGGA